MEFAGVIKVFIPSVVAFWTGIFITPFLTHFLYKNQMWKKEARTKALGGGEAVLFNKLHKERETTVPRMGGIIIWTSSALTVFLFAFLADFFPGDTTEKLNFLSRNQTWLPFFVLIVASIVGLVDDFLAVSGKGDSRDVGLTLKTRIAIVLTLGAGAAWWFFFKLGVSSIIVPFWGEVSLGYLFIPLFMLVMLALFSGGVIDGIDGLAGGIFAIVFAAYAGIAFFQEQNDLAAFCAVIVGALLAFLWFNIPPARFYMSETGVLGLTTTLTVVAFLTKAVVVLPIIAFFIFAAPASNIIQLLSKRFRDGKKVFLIAPVHHHFEALGWPPYKVTMRLWILSAIFAIIGMTIALIG